MSKNKNAQTPRIKVIQKLYGNLINPDQEIEYPKSQYKKFIKDVVQGTIDRNDLIEETFNNLLNQSAFKAQTGPARRGDKKTIALHHDLLPDELKKIYHTITSSIDKTYN